MCNIIYWEEHFKAVDVALKGSLKSKRRLGSVCISGLIEDFPSCKTAWVP